MSLGQWYMKTFTLLLFCLLAFNTTFAQNNYPPMAAFTSDGRLFVYGYDSEPIQLTDPRLVLPPNDIVRWSPDGRLLAFTHQTIKLYDTETNDILSLRAVPWGELPIAFSMDGSHILFDYEGGQYSSFGPFYHTISRISVEPEAIADTVGIFEVAGGYGAGGFYSPAQAVYENEIGDYFGYRILEDTPLGILHYTVNGLELWNSPEGAGLGSEPLLYAVTSPDRTRIATFHVGSIRIIDLATQAVTGIERELPPNLLAWSENNVIFYSSIQRVRDLYDELTEEEQVQLNTEVFDYYYDELDNQLPYREVSIRQINLSSGIDQEVYRAEAYAIGRLMPTPDGSNVYFSVIPNLDTWVQETLNGNMNCDEIEEVVNSRTCSLQHSEPSLYRLNVSTGEVELIGEGLYNATINFAAMSNQ